MIILNSGEPESDIPGSLFPKHVQVVQISDTAIIGYDCTIIFYLANINPCDIDGIILVLSKWVMYLDASDNRTVKKNNYYIDKKNVIKQTLEPIFAKQNYSVL